MIATALDRNTVLMRLVNLIEALAATLSAKKAKLRRLLNPCSHEFIRIKLDGTLDWFLSNPIVESWLATSSLPSPNMLPSSRLLLVHGSKGSGKSVLAALTANHVSSTGILCAFFSFFHGIERQRKFKSMFSTVLWQMLNLIADFVIYTGAGTRRVHFCHFSLEEVLLLPQEKWTGRLELIEFFWLDLSECHQLVGRAAVEYVTHCDFGYPLVEDSYHQLIEKPFLVHTTRNGPSHLLHWSSKSMNETLKPYITSSNFGGLLEFVGLPRYKTPNFSRIISVGPLTMTFQTSSQ